MQADHYYAIRMKLAIDCRYLGKSGIGRVCEGLIDALSKGKDELYLIGKKSLLTQYQNAILIADDSEPYSLRGLFSYPKELNGICDGILIPNFLIPFGIRIPVYTIMHDVAFLDVAETTRGFFDKMIKRYLLNRCMKRSKIIFCVSKFTKSRCKAYYGKLADKCAVNYNGVSKNVFSFANTHRTPQKENTVVFVGNVKPHKGLDILLTAFRGVKNMTLEIIGEKENFLTGLRLDEKVYPNVTFTGKLGDTEMFQKIQAAKYLVLPSRYEGFGLPPLEALCLGTQPIVSDIEVFREVYSGLPVRYFSDVTDLTEKLNRPPDHIDCLEKIAKRYRYRECADNLISAIKKSK